MIIYGLKSQDCGFDSLWYESQSVARVQSCKLKCNFIKLQSHEDTIEHYIVYAKSRKETPINHTDGWGLEKHGVSS